MFQPDKITNLAVSVFKEEGQLAIRAQGILKRMYLSAYLSVDKQEIHPPREHYYFNRNSHTPRDGAFLRKVATYFILTDEEADAMVQQWELWIVAVAGERNVRFGDYGIFRFEDQLDFESESLYIYEWLPSVRYHSTGKPSQNLTEEQVSEMATVSFEKPPKKRKILVPVLWSVLGALFAFSLFLWSEPLNLLIDQNAELKTRLVNVAPESYSLQDEIAYYNDTHKVQPDNSPATAITSGNNTEDSETIHEWRVNEDKEKEHSYGSETVIPAENVPGISKTDPVIVPTEPPKRCTLILGAFANPDNVTRMVDRLNGYNLKAVTMERKTLTLVGADIECGDQSQISKLKQEIEPNAWLYKN